MELHKHNKTEEILPTTYAKIAIEEEIKNHVHCLIEAVASFVATIALLIVFMLCAAVYI